MRIGSFDFRPGLVPTIAFVVLLPMLIALGFWQLDRAEQRAALLASFDAQRTAQRVDLNRDQLDPERMLFRPARADGEFLPDRSLLLDNQTHRRTVGYHVLTPYRLADGGQVVLVDRGWVPAGDSRARLPDVAMEAPQIPIEGHLDQGPPTGIRLGGIADGESGWPLRVQYIDYPELGERIGVELLPVVLRLAPDSAEGFVREWRPEHPDGYGPERNRAYAVQWFGLAAALVVIYVAVNLRRRPEEPND